jgi:hypothetical protein
MPLSDPHQADDFPGEPFLHAIPHPLHDHALQNARVSFRHRVILPFPNPRSLMSIPSQVPPAPANGQLEGHRDIPPPVRGVTGPGTSRVHDPDHFDVAYQGIVDYHPQPLLDVSNSHPSASGAPFAQ